MFIFLYILDLCANHIVSGWRCQVGAVSSKLWFVKDNDKYYIMIELF
jgi:hypothetical protein